MSDDQEIVSIPLLSVAAAAKYLGVTRKMVYQLIEHREIKGVKVKGSVRIEQQSLADFRASGKMM